MRTSKDEQSRFLGIIRNRKCEDLIGEHDALLVNIIEIARQGGDVVKEILRFQS
jgi:hypothetical protein